MDNYHVVYQDNSWRVKGVNKSLVFETKKIAVDEAKRIAQEKDRSVVIHTQDGRISEVVTNGKRYAKGQRILSAHGKRRLKGDNVRNSIANAMANRSKK